MLGLVGKFIVFHHPFEILTLDFLQTDNIRLHLVKGSGDAFHFDKTIEGWHAFMDVITGDD